MTQWRLVPSEVETIVGEVADLRPDLDAAFSEHRVERVFEYLTWGGGLTSEVPNAVGLLLADQQDRLANIGNRVDAGRVGVALAAAAYEAGAEDLYEAVQSEMVATAGDGDFTYFEPFLEPPA